MIKLKIMENFNIQMALNMKEIGKMTSSMVMAKKFGLIILFMKEILYKGKKMEKVCIIIFFYFNLKIRFIYLE